jgi:hypothetical protein
MAANPAVPAPVENLSLNDLGLMSQTGVAKLFKKSLRTIQRMEERGQLPPAIDVGRTPYYRRESVLACFAERERSAAFRRRQQPPKPRKRKPRRRS